MPDKPHIVIFNRDQWRGDAPGHVGHPAVRTPNIDLLVAEEAVSFRKTGIRDGQQLTVLRPRGGSGRDTEPDRRSALRQQILRLKERMLTWYMEPCDVVPLETDRRNFVRA